MGSALAGADGQKRLHDWQRHTKKIIQISDEVPSAIPRIGLADNIVSVSLHPCSPGYNNGDDSDAPLQLNFTAQKYFRPLSNRLK